MLFNTWGSRNRVISQPLQTTYTRVFETVLAYDAAGNRLPGSDTFFWHYVRIRTKQYRYVGMTQAAAMQCAASLNDLYNRRYVDQYLNSRIWTHRDHHKNQYVKMKQCGNAQVMREAGNSFSVEVQVNEQFDYRYHTTNTGAGGKYLVFTAFEDNPDVRTWQFRGWQDSTQPDFDYDED